MSEQPPFAVDAAAIAGKACIRADDPVARNHDGDRVELRYGMPNPYTAASVFFS